MSIQGVLGGRMQDLHRKSATLSRVLFVAVAFSFLMLLFTALVLFNVARVGVNADRDVLHTLETKQAIAKLLTTIMTAEAGQRGFLITGETQSLLPYNKARESVPLQLDGLRTLMLDNPVQAARIDALKLVVGQRLNTIEDTLILVRQNRRAEVAQILRTRGESLMSDIRERIATIGASESQVLLQRRANSAKVRGQFLAAIFAVLIACAILTVSALISVRRYMGAVDENRRRLAAYNTELERCEV